MMAMTDYTTYLSPFTWRYGTPAMRRLWSEHNKRLLWRQIWLALAEVQAEYGLVTAKQAADLRAHADEIDLPRALEIEAEIQHDLMAELRVFAGQCPAGGGIIHLGATSMDVEDNADALRLRAALDLLLESLSALLRTFGLLIEKYADTPLMAFTHLQPAEPSTLGYRLALYGQDLLEDYQVIRNQVKGIRGKGFKGAVGTSAAYAELIGAEKLTEFEQKLSAKLDLPFYPVASQVYPRKQDYEIVSALAGLGASLYKFAFDLRLLQSPPLGELGEPFGEKQVGSSAMPFKRNPIRAEKINSLARYLAALPRIAWDNAAHSLLERTLDDSANRRIFLPEACLAADELLRTANSLLKGLRVDEAAMSRNLTVYGPFAATERVLMALVKAGADRQEMHERLRGHAMKAWEAIRTGGENPLASLLCQDAILTEYLSEEDIRRLMDARSHVGDAPQRAREMAKLINETL
ncbi:MAG: adenylosuccinate lyase [Anaerolineaceae bacterium]|nr:MAG: adenylosuccinate lyase [Anaerolineaceae bacterium]